MKTNKRTSEDRARLAEYEHCNALTKAHMDKKNNQIKDGGPAFPVICENGLGHISNGMSLKDWFAGMALSNPDISLSMDLEILTAEERTALRCYRYADAMISERERQNAPAQKS